jgi:glycosyltransferase involved in cell wall biosynthesis
MLVFLGRLHPKKGCDLLIDAFARVATHVGDARLVMAGPDSAEWRAALERRAAAAGVADRILWTGMLHGSEKWAALFAAEALVLPSHQENFGFVVAEALGCGVPVLISDKVNIWREVADAGAGFVAPDTIEGTVELLERWAALDRAALAALRDAARTCHAARYSADAMARSLEQALAPIAALGTGRAN